MCCAWWRGIKCLCKSVKRLQTCFLFLAICFCDELGEGLGCRHSSSTAEYGLSCLQGWDWCSVGQCYVHSWEEAGVFLLLTYRQICDIAGIRTVTLTPGVQMFMEFRHQAFQTPPPFSCSCSVCHCTCIIFQ